MCLRKMRAFAVASEMGGGYMSVEVPTRHTFVIGKPGDDYGASYIVESLANMLSVMCATLDSI